MEAPVATTPPPEIVTARPCGPRGRALLALALVAVTAWLPGAGSSAAGAQGPASALQGYRETIGGTTVAYEMVPVPGGTVNLDGDDIAVNPFLIGRTEVTWDMYDVFALRLDVARDTGDVDAIARPSEPYGAPDYGWGHAGYPAISITHQAAEAFCAWLSAVTGRAYRLPTEAEWAHAAALAAAGAPTGAREALTWHRGNAKGTTHPVSTRKPDALGLFDLFGNAAEWVTTADGGFTTRGGSFRDPLERTGPDARTHEDPSWTERDPQLPKSSWWLSDGPFVGFRLARSED
jgi:formylglycine-generating enzyme required for sulfatase activity